MKISELLERYGPQLGEIVQHGLNVDQEILKNSDWYLGLIEKVLDRHRYISDRRPVRFLEIACYRHIIGYVLSRKYGFEVTLFDLSKEDLEAGRDVALEQGLTDRVERVSGDFHSLPFSDNYFDVVFISAAIHHSKTPEAIIREALRVLSSGGIFYSQREPCKRLFCFYQFLANRAAEYTPIEKHLFEKDLLRIFSSPFHGARNAQIFGRVENDQIPLKLYYDTFRGLGEISEEVLFHEGLLTKLDKEILERSHGNRDKISAFIEDRLNSEIAIALPLIGERERLLGISLPSKQEVQTMARKVGQALANLPTSRNKIEWRRAMAEIFGASLRFVVKRKTPHAARAESKFNREMEISGSVVLDNEVNKTSQLLFWETLFPHVQRATPELLFSSGFNADHWRYTRAPTGVVSMRNTTSVPSVRVPKYLDAVVVVMRFRAYEYKDQIVRLIISYDGIDMDDITIVQTEDRMTKFPCSETGGFVTFRVMTMDNHPIEHLEGIAVSIFQVIPLTTNREISRSAAVVQSSPVST